MDLDFDSDTVRFREEVREFLRDNIPERPLRSMDTADGFEAHREWERMLARHRYSVVSWPRDLGGRDASVLEWLLFEEEYYAAEAPGRVSQNGIFLLAPTLFAHGTDEQLRRILPRMAAGDDIWAQAWSEPEAGSDLAGIRSSAHRTDGGWLLRGQKTWSSRAGFADKAFGLFRSDPAAERHRGLTYCMFSLTADGVTVRPIPQLNGESGFAEIFLDDVFVPDDDVLGAVHDGWRVAMSTSSNERGMSLRSPGRFVAAADRLVRLFREHGDASDTAVAHRVVDAWIGAQAYRLHTFGTATTLTDGGSLGAESSLTKVFWSELDVALHETALDVLGTDAEVRGPWTDGFVFSLSGPIYAGTNEIQRGVIAERLLGLPKAHR
ncbi:acyl-CoA dehydrogenase [Rhodococcus sp. Eu-32]|uniref:acyl-CoA dehydrogenase family protein n=1 Tax=Rhodococcus sp. Eu-32 TaxID=1017319 RepID=UPI000DF19665|nr:acyl-CoA dehydrogenase family protein [Rhodococcus sp. Eu-32]RRQ27226.1 acyl-CoA dehydrogenase [Rhodococcus sp. Eu-32]